MNKAILLGIILLLSMAMTYPSSNSPEMKPKVLHHVVMFKFKEGTSTEDIDQIIKAFADLKNKIKTIQSFEWGLNNSPENLNQGFTHIFQLTFKSEKDRDDYLPHPDHKAFGKVLGPHLEKVMVMDYWANK
ncbi:MAG: Dabb family protein [Saprospiraceae bacterium]